MTVEFDFERYWLAKFSKCLDDSAGGAVRREVMQGSADLTATSSRRDVISWSNGAMERLEALVDEKTRVEVMTGCACQYPKSDLQDVRAAYQASGDIDLAHQMLQQRFESFLLDTLQLSEKHFQQVVDRGWGLAGVRQANIIYATKIPKSGYLIEYLEESDPDKRRQLYCHCPRVREALKMGESLSPTYCYCGAGYYKGVWEEILGQPVQVEVLESVLQGDDVCKIAVHLPSDC